MEEFDFVETYKGLMTQITDAPVEFIEASALFLISSAVARNFQFMSLPDAPIFKQSLDPMQTGGRLLNLWFVLIGRSRIARKSTVIGRAKELIELIDEELLLPTDFTPQKLISILAEKTRNGETRAVWIHDEISGFFEALRKADYMVTTDAILSKIYDGTTYVRATVSRGKETIVNPYLTVLVASTEYLPTLFDETRLRQGFLNRFIYVVGQRKRRLALRSSLTPEEERIAKLVYVWLDTVYRREIPVFMNFNAEAKSKYDEFEAKIEENIEKKELGIYEGYYGNLPNFLIKLSCIFRISRMTVDEISEYSRPVLEVEEEDFERAEKYVWQTWKWFEEVVKMMRTTALSKPVLTEENKLEMVYSIISRYGRITRSELYRKANLLASELEEILTTLISQGRIQREIIKTTGRPKVIYFVSDGGG